MAAFAAPEMIEKLKASAAYYTGLLIVALCTVMYEVLLTRIFSVTTWYHLAFLAISLAMLGMSIGAIVVYFRPDVFVPESNRRLSALSALLFAFTSVLAIMAHIYAPIALPLGPAEGIVVSLAVAIPLLLIAFAFSGICVSLALTRYPSQVNRLYAADLIGASIGCAGIVYLLQFVDGISAVFVIAAATCGAAAFFAGRESTKLMAVGIAGAVLLGAFACFNAAVDKPIVTVSWAKGAKEPPVLWQRWNSFSRIRVLGDAEHALPRQFLYSPAIDAPKVRELTLDIDGSASTALTYFNGDTRVAEHLKYDIASMVHYLRPQSKVLVIGMGGGRDILASLVMGQKSVTAVEINPNIIKAVCGVFGDFTGHLDKLPQVHVVNSEGRSYVSHTDQYFDIILASFVDTAAASASGAYALSENSLYTVDCWREFLQHLNPNGIATMSRFYVRGQPAEFYRLTALAAEALREEGISDARRHMCAVLFDDGNPAMPTRQATLLVSKAPFSQADLDTLKTTADKLKFIVLLSPTTAYDPMLARIADGEDQAKLTQEVPWNIKPPTDDNPFFFQTFSIIHAFDKRNTSPDEVVGVFLVFVAILISLFCVYCVRIPLKRTQDKAALAGAGKILSYFFLIGLGFMFIEIAQIQRFTIFLGHPTYGATVALTPLLLGTGLGSLLVKPALDRISNSTVVAAIILGVLIGSCVGIGTIIHVFAHAATPVRMVSTALSLLPIGFVLGTLFPFGMTVANDRYPSLTPWLWAINGCASVLGSVLTVLASIYVGITFSLCLGVLCYLGAVILLVKLRTSHLV